MPIHETRTDHNEKRNFNRIWRVEDETNALEVTDTINGTVANRWSRHFGPHDASSDGNIRGERSETGRGKKPQHLNATQTDTHGCEHTNRREFVQKVRLFYKIIKTIHHHRNVTQNQAPKAIRQVAYSLMNIIKPAMFTDLTADLIQGNARNWECTTIIILTDHSINLLDALMKELCNHPAKDWKDSFRVAVTWTKRRLGRRLLPKSVREAEEIILKNFSNKEDLQTETQEIITSLQNRNTHKVYTEENIDAISTT